MNGTAAVETRPPLTALLGSAVSGLSFDSLPHATRAHVKLCILDTLGCGLFGSGQPWGRIVADVAEETAGGQHQLWGRDARAGAVAAATANGTAVHGFELDDVHLSGQLHPGAVTVPAVWAVAEMAGSSGPALMTAVAAGYEVGIRMGVAAGRGHGLSGFHPTGTLGAVAAAAGVARVLGLDAEHARHALALGATQAAGLYSARTGGMSKRFHAGHAAGAGVAAGLLARRGFTAAEDAIEAGFGGLMSAMRFDGDPAALVQGLGGDWLLDGVGFKIFATCASAQTVVEGVLSLRDQGITAATLASLDIHMGSIAVSNVGWPYRPRDVVAAQMNGSYAAAVALLDGDAFVDQFRPGRLDDPAVLDLTQRIRFHLDPDIERGGLALRHASRIVARLHDGTLRTVYNAQRPGGPGKEIPQDAVVDKFIRLATPVIGQKGAGTLRDRILCLEEETDLRALSSLLGGQHGST